MMLLSLVFSVLVYLPTVLINASDICTGDINEWEDCPTNPKVYEGCSHVITEFFHSVNHSCHNEFEYYTEVNNKNIAPMVTLVNGSIDCCNISVEFVVLQVDHTVMFTAKELVNLSANPIKIDCNDTLDIYTTLPSPHSIKITSNSSTIQISWLEPYILPGYSIYQYNITISDQNETLYNKYTSSDTQFEIESEEVNNGSCIEIYGVYCGGEGESLFAPLLADDMSSPVNITIEVTCDGVNVTWSVSTGLLQYNIDGYNLSIPQLNVSYMSQETEIYIPFADDVYSFHQEYEITVTANVCKGSGQAGSAKFQTSIVPKLSDVINYTISVVNVTHVAVTFKAKLLDIDCPLSHPTMVDIVIWCNGVMIVNDTESITVSGDHSDLIIAERFLPAISQNCNVTLNFRNIHKNGKIFYISIKGNDTFEMTSSNRFNVRYSCVLYCCKATTNHISSCDWSIKNNYKQIVQISVGNEIDNTCNGSQSLVCYDFVVTQNDKKSSSVMQPTPEASSSVMPEPSQTPTTCSSNSNWQIATIVSVVIFGIIIVILSIAMIIAIRVYMKRISGNFTPTGRREPDLEMHSIPDRTPDDDQKSLGYAAEPKIVQDSNPFTSTLVNPINDKKSNREEGSRTHLLENNTTTSAEIKHETDEGNEPPPSLEDNGKCVPGNTNQLSTQRSINEELVTT